MYERKASSHCQSIQKCVGGNQNDHGLFLFCLPDVSSGNSLSLGAIAHKNYSLSETLALKIYLYERLTQIRLR
jgi:hypothetical protein